MEPRHLVETVTSEMGPGTLERASCPPGCYYGWNLNMLMQNMGRCPWLLMMHGNLGCFWYVHRKSRLQRQEHMWIGAYLCAQLDYVSFCPALTSKQLDVHYSQPQIHAKSKIPLQTFSSEQIPNFHFLETLLLIPFSITAFILLQITSINHVFQALYRAVIDFEQGTVYQKISSFYRSKKLRKGGRKSNFGGRSRSVKYDYNLLVEFRGLEWNFIMLPFLSINFKIHSILHSTQMPYSYLTMLH